jgi:hypothetical protein
MIWGIFILVLKLNHKDLSTLVLEDKN